DGRDAAANVPVRVRRARVDPGARSPARDRGGELHQHPRVDPVGLTGQPRQALDLLGIRDLDVPAGELEAIVYEERTVHRLDRRADRLAAARETLAQPAQTISIRWRRTDLDRPTSAVSRWKS